LNEKELYEKQYGERKLINANSFPFLRKVFKSFDLHREDLAVSLLEGGEKLLDVGCGSGSLMFKAKDKFKNVYGIDISPSRIDEAKKKAVEKFGENNNLHFSVCNINEKIDFPDDMFDAVTSIAVIEHVFDPYYVVSEIHRVLKSGGVFVVEVPNIAYIRHRIDLLFGKLPVTSSPYNWKEIGWDGGHLRYFTKKTLCGLLGECGFEVLKVTGSGLFARFRNFYPSLLTGDICIKARKC
jgi:2-polyprenyl-3-methyl-5-hydroxy-6-metoxy-1,4-benzoquinol methylase